MPKKIGILFVLLLYLTLSTLWGQTQSEIDLIKNSIPTGLNKIHYTFAKNPKNELQLIFSGLFLFYKYFISSQDLPDICNFHPSCSEYGILSIKKNGVIVGTLSTFDRLTRCNGLNKDQYVRDEKTGKLLDYP